MGPTNRYVFLYFFLLFFMKYDQPILIHSFHQLILAIFVLFFMKYNQVILIHSFHQLILAIFVFYFSFHPRNHLDPRSNGYPYLSESPASGKHI